MVWEALSDRIMLLPLPGGRAAGTKLVLGGNLANCARDSCMDREGGGNQVYPLLYWSWIDQECCAN